MFGSVLNTALTPNGHPGADLKSGTFAITGEYRWNKVSEFSKMPLNLALNLVLPIHLPSNKCF